MIRITNLATPDNTSIFKGCEFYNLTGTTATAGAALSLEETGVAAVVNNCTFHNNTSGTAGYEDIKASMAIDVNNCIFDDNDTTNGAITFAYCCSLGTVESGTGNVVVTAPYTDIANNDYTLVDGTDCIGGGLGDTSHYVGVNGEPFSNFGRDIGSNMTTFGSFHPANL